MRKLLILLFCAVNAFATTTISGNLKTLGAANVTGAYVRFWLRGCQGNQPRINGTGIIAPSQGGVFFVDLIASSSGVISGTIYSTRDASGNNGGDIECGGSTTAVWYGMQTYSAGKGGPEVPVQANSGATLDISNVTPITTNPVVTAPTGDATYARLDGGNQPFTGNLQFGALSGLISPTIKTGLTADGSGFKHKRGTAGCATAASAGAVCTTTVTWTTAFANANYTVVCAGDVITSGVPLSGGITAKLAASVTFQTVAATAVAAQYTNVECIAVHD